jgi:hypothetical protein
MSDTIYKYSLPLDDIVRIPLPFGARVLSVGEQHGQLVLWALVNPAYKTLLTTFRIAGTGHPIVDAEHWNFIGTVQTREGSLVWHVFQKEARYEEPR